MAAGFRSFAAFWIGGIAGGGAAPPEPSCPCPPWTQEQTLLNAFGQRLEASSNLFVQPETLFNAFGQKLEESTSLFKQSQTLTSQWGRKNCD